MGVLVRVQSMGEMVDGGGALIPCWINFCIPRWMDFFPAVLEGGIRGKQKFLCHDYIQRTRAE